MFTPQQLALISQALDLNNWSTPTRGKTTEEVSAELDLHRDHVLAFINKHGDALQKLRKDLFIALSVNYCAD